MLSLAAASAKGAAALSEAVHPPGRRPVRLAGPRRATPRHAAVRCIRLMYVFRDGEVVGLLGACNLAPLLPDKGMRNSRAPLHPFPPLFSSLVRVLLGLFGIFLLHAHCSQTPRCTTCPAAVLPTLGEEP